MHNKTIENKKADVLIKKVPDALITTLLAAVITTVVFWRYATLWILFTWLAAFTIVTGIRYYLLYRLKWDLGDVHSRKQWLQIFTISALFSGVMWGFMGAYIINTQPIHIATIIIVIAGYIVIGTVINYSVLMSAFIAFSASAILPVIFSLFLQDNTISQTYGILLIVFYAYAIISAFRHRFLTDAYLAYEISNTSLLDELRKEQAEAKHLNQKLEEDLDILRQTEEQLQQEKSKAQEMADKLLTLSSHDGLTGIANRRTFDKVLAKEWNRAVRSQTPLSLILGDIDYFKAYNDYYGHQQGDNSLMRVALILDEHTKRAGDLAARYGGEEFALILPETSLENAASIAEEIRKAIETAAILHRASDIDNVITMSLGVATIVPRHEQEPHQLIALADKVLYKAKKEGRNRVVISKPDFEVMKKSEKGLAG